MTTIRNVRQLWVYQKSLKSLPKLYEVVYSIPKSHFKQRRQLTNSGEAIAPLISEGWTKRRNDKEATRFFEMAMTESDEVVVHLEQAIILGERFGSIKTDLAEELMVEYTTISKGLYNLIQKWNQGVNLKDEMS